MKKYLIMSAFLALGMFVPKTSKAYSIRGWATVTTRLDGGGTVVCNGPAGTCFTISGSNIVIQHWSGVIYGTLDPMSVSPDIPDGYPVDFETDGIIPED
jgi:hypothetical protein